MSDVGCEKSQKPFGVAAVAFEKNVAGLSHLRADPTRQPHVASSTSRTHRPSRNAGAHALIGVHALTDGLTRARPRQPWREGAFFDHGGREGGCVGHGGREAKGKKGGSLRRRQSGLWPDSVEPVGNESG